MLKSIFTDSNQDLDAGRILYAVSVVSAIGFEGVAIIAKNQPFDSMAFCSGLAALLAGGGFGVAIRDKVSIKKDDNESE